MLLPLTTTSDGFGSNTVPKLAKPDLLNIMGSIQTEKKLEPCHA